VTHAAWRTAGFERRIAGQSPSSASPYGRGEGLAEPKLLAIAFRRRCRFFYHATSPRWLILDGVTPGSGTDKQSILGYLRGTVLSFGHCLLRVNGGSGLFTKILWIRSQYGRL
jgi:hypothetical protein